MAYGLISPAEMEWNGLSKLLMKGINFHSRRAPIIGFEISFSLTWEAELDSDGNSTIKAVIGSYSQKSTFQRLTLFLFPS